MAKFEIQGKSTLMAYGHTPSCEPLRGYSTPNQNVEYFVLYLKISNAFLKNGKCIL